MGAYKQNHAAHAVANTAANAYKELQEAPSSLARKQRKMPLSAAHHS